MLPTNLGGYLSLSPADRELAFLMQVVGWAAEVDAGIDITPGGVINRAACFSCLDDSTVNAMAAVSMQEILLFQDSEADTTPKGVISEASCFLCLEPGLQRIAMIEAVPRTEEDLPDASDVLGGSDCFRACTERIAPLVALLLTEIHGALDSEADTSTTYLAANSACFACLDPSTLEGYKWGILRQIIIA